MVTYLETLQDSGLLIPERMKKCRLVENLYTKVYRGMQVYFRFMHGDGAIWESDSWP